MSIDLNVGGFNIFGLETLRREKATVEGGLTEVSGHRDLIGLLGLRAIAGRVGADLPEGVVANILVADPHLDEGVLVEVSPLLSTLVDVHTRDFLQSRVRSLVPCASMEPSENINVTTQVLLEWKMEKRT